MLYSVLVGVWILMALGWIISHFRDGGSERKIESFRAEHDEFAKRPNLLRPANALSGVSPRETVVFADTDINNFDRIRMNEYNTSYSEYEEAYGRQAPVEEYYPYRDDARHVGPMQHRRRSITRTLLIATVVLFLASVVVGGGFISFLFDLDLIAGVGYGTMAVVAYMGGVWRPGFLPERREAPLATVSPIRGRLRDRLEGLTRVDEFESYDDEEEVFPTRAFG
jgi:hypothetical protein